MEKEVELESTLYKRLEEVSPPTLVHCIYKVPRQLLEVNRKAYEPEMVSIGHFHHNRPRVKKMEEHKLNYLHSLLKRKDKVPLKSYISAIAVAEEKARNCYAEPISLKSVEFIDMLVVDGCFIIEFLRQLGVCEHPYISSRLRNSLHRDLILFENQIPFFVLCTLFDVIEGPDQRHQLTECLKNFCRVILPGDVKLYEVKKLEGVKHILDFVHTSLCPPADSSHHHHDSTSESVTLSLPPAIPTATQLQDSNVKFKKTKHDRNTPLFDVEFKGKCGMFQSAQMLMPTLVIEHATESLLRNLIAFEQHFPKEKPTPFIDYALLLDCLINSAEDVQVLSRYGIIENKLGCDEMVANFVNRLTHNIIYSGHKFKYAEIFDRVNDHYKNPWNQNVVIWNRTVAEVRQNYFSSPWSCISAVAASVLLLLTVAQTVYAALEYRRRN